MCQNTKIGLFSIKNTLFSPLFCIILYRKSKTLHVYWKKSCKSLVVLRKVCTFASAFEVQPQGASSLRRLHETGEVVREGLLPRRAEESISWKFAIFGTGFFPVSRTGRGREDNWNYIYNGEFDPGSGWTLATGLTHASRGAACRVLAHDDGDRRTGE